MLSALTELLERHRIHAHLGAWNGYRDLHVGPDWPLASRIIADEGLVAPTGTHADLLGPRDGLAWLWRRPRQATEKGDRE